MNVATDRGPAQGPPGCVEIGCKGSWCRFTLAVSASGALVVWRVNEREAFRFDRHAWGRGSDGGTTGLMSIAVRCEP